MHARTIIGMACLLTALLLRPAAGAGIVGDNCDTAPIFCGGFADADTTVGAADDFNLGGAGACAGGGTQFAGTGTGPDLAYGFRQSAGAEITVVMTPAATVDLTVYVLRDCAEQAASCQGVSDNGGAGAAEQLTFNADADATYFIIVDGFGGAKGAFDIVVSTSNGDADGDGVEDPCDICAEGDDNIDADGDGIPDACDPCPLVGDADSDGDGACDSQDECPTDPNKTSPGTCGCGQVESDRDSDGLADCADGCPDDPDKFAPGDCGCGTADSDANGDGVSDCIKVSQAPNDPAQSGAISNGGDGTEAEVPEPTICNDGCGTGVACAAMLPAMALSFCGIRRRKKARRMSKKRSRADKQSDHSHASQQRSIHIAGRLPLIATTFLVAAMFGSLGVNCGGDGAANLASDGPRWGQLQGNELNDGLLIVPTSPATPVNLDWEADIGPVLFSSPVIAPDGLIIVGTVEGDLVAVTPAGTIKWQRRFFSNAPELAPVAKNKNAVAAIAQPDDPTQPPVPIDPPDDPLPPPDPFAPDRIHSTPAVADDGSVYVNTMFINEDLHFATKLRKLDAAGNQVWVREAVTGFTTASPKVAGDHIFVAGLGELRVFDGNGNLVDIHTTLGCDIPECGDDGGLLDQLGEVAGDIYGIGESIVGDFIVEDVLDCFSLFLLKLPDTCAIQFGPGGVKSPPDNTRFHYPMASVAVAEGNPTIVVVADSLCLSAFEFDGNQLGLIWQQSLHGGCGVGAVQHTSPSITGEGYVLIGNELGQVRAFGLLTGDEFWTADLDAPVLGIPATIGQRTFITTPAGIQALDGDGNPLGSVPGAAAGGAAISANFIHVNSVEGLITRSHDLSSFDVHDSFVGAPGSAPAIGGDGTIYAMTAGGTLRAYHDDGAVPLSLNPLDVALPTPADTAVDVPPAPEAPEDQIEPEEEQEVASDTPPTASIDSPGNGDTVGAGASLTLVASGSDTEDGDLPDSAFSWFSDRDGALGTGRTIDVTLSGPPDCDPITHVVTLRVTDSDGNVTERQIQISVNRVC